MVSSISIEELSSLLLFSDDWITDERSLMCITNARGPILLPWGTPSLILIGSENTFSNFVTWDLPWRYDASQARTDFEFLTILQRPTMIHKIEEHLPKIQKVYSYHLYYLFFHSLKPVICDTNQGQDGQRFRQTSKLLLFNFTTFT